MLIVVKPPNRQGVRYEKDRHLWRDHAAAAPPGFLRFNPGAELRLIYGGGEANVAVSVATTPTWEFVTRLPKNPIGDACLNFIRQFGVGTAHIARGGDRLGIYFLETVLPSVGSNVIYDRAVQLWRR